MKSLVSLWSIPENVSLNILATVIAGFAKLVKAVNQYAAVIHNATSAGTASVFYFTPSKIVSTRPEIANTSEKYCDRPVLAVVDN